MPPKKATTTKAKATEAKTPAATAASERPRRAAANPPAPTPSKKAATKKAPAQAATTKTTEPTKKRGRPRKAEQAEAEPEADAEEPPKKRGRGRPAKNDGTSSKDTPAVPEQETAPPKKRGRPPKGGETTKDPEDDPAAAEQLEEELDDAVEANQEEATSKPVPTKKGKGAAKGRSRKAKPAEDEGVDADATAAGADAEEDVEMEGTDASAGKNFWLMKAEQVDREEKLQDGSSFNTKFTVDELRDKGGPEPWDGVRNPTACKNMREMKLGDLAFFYASGAKGKAVQPGIVGIMEIVKEAEPDTSAFDEKHQYYVQNAKQRGTPEHPRWYMVHVEHRKKLIKPVTLKELQQYKHASGVLANMQEFTAARLSVSKVTENEWNFIVENLIEGYEEDETAPTTATASKDGSAPSKATKGKEDSVFPDASITVNGTAPPAEDDVVPTSEPTAPAPKGGTSRASRKPSTSRAASRASSKAPQDKLAPPRAQSRGRSRTPASRAGSVKPGKDGQGLKGVAEEIETVEE